jgi:hypothetical protein
VLKSAILEILTFGGSNNAFNEFNSAAFAAIKGNGSIIAWNNAISLFRLS